MVRYEFVIKDNQSDMLELEYDPEHDEKNMWVSITDADGNTGIPVYISIQDVKSLKCFVDLVLSAMERAKLEKELDNG